MTAHNNNKQRADTKSVLAASQFPLLLRFSIVSVMTMISIATILVFLYRQDQLAEHGKFAAQNNEKDAIHLMQLLDEQINTLVSGSKGFDNKTLQANPHIGLFTDALKMVREHDILKLKIYNLSGTTIYSSVKSEIGGTSHHPDKLAKALSGEVTSQLGFRDTFIGTNGELRNVYIASVYMPLSHAGKRIGAIEVYTDVTSFFELVNANTIRIPLIVFSAFALLYAALFFTLLKTDRAAAEWQVAAVRDIAGRKLAEEQIRKLNEELETKVHERTKQLLAAQEELVRKEKLALLGLVAGSVGHELRNPLGVMSNAVYYLQTVLSDADETTKEYLNIIKSEIAVSERMASDLMDAVRTKPPQLEVVGVAELIEQTLRNFTLPASVSIKLDIPVTLPSLLVDAQQTMQVLLNLISNGIEAMPQGGTLQISAVADAAAKKITFSVRDSGVGMTPEQLGKLFQPLFTTKARGIGLGLVVVKNLVEANGGSVDVQSEAGKGTLFTVTLPATDESGVLI